MQFVITPDIEALTTLT